MECKTIKYVKKDGTPVIVNKVKYKTITDANKHVESINQNKKVYIKRKSYKCSKCGFYHIGSTKEMLDKPLPKLKWMGPRHIKLNIIGNIDLSSNK